MRHTSTPREVNPLRTGAGGVGLVVLLLLLAVALVIGLNARYDQEDRSVNQEQPAREDVFADLNEEDGVQWKPGEGGLDDEPWEQALDYVQQAEDILVEATAANESGDTDLAKQKWIEARDLYSRALDAAKPWQRAALERYGDGDARVTRADRLTTAWGKELADLRQLAR